MMPTVFAFTEDEAREVEQRLSQLVRALRIVPGGGKIVEGHWSYIYHQVRGAISPGWSNLPMRDFCHSGLGVEMKLLKRKAPLQAQGRRLMHPAATRTITYDPRDDENVCKDVVLTQFGQKIIELRERVAATAPGAEPDVRWGVLLWRTQPDQFLYFEGNYSA